MIARNPHRCIRGLYEAAHGLIGWDQAMDGLADFLRTSSVRVRPIRLSSKQTLATWKGKSPHGAGETLTESVILEADHDLSILLTVAGDLPLRESAGSPWGPVRRHLRQAVLFWIREGRRTAALEAARQLLHNARFPAVLTDSTLRLITCNGSAQRLLQADDYLIRRSQALTCRDARTTNVIIGCIVNHQVGYVRLRDVSGMSSIGLFIIPLAIDMAVASPRHHAFAMLAVHDPNSAPKLNTHFVSAALRITAGESLIGVLLASGLTVEQVARELQISVATVRSHVKSLLQKTGTNRQVELVRLISTLSDAKAESAKSLDH